MSPGHTDATTVRRYLVALDQILARLEHHKGQAASLLDQDIDERWAVERGLQLCTQCVIDIATHLVAAAGRDAPDYTSAIEELGRLSIVPAELAAKLRPLAGFRNALVHGYLGLDSARLHAVLNQHLDDVKQFAAVIDRYIAEQP